MQRHGLLSEGPGVGMNLLLCKQACGLNMRGVGPLEPFCDKGGEAIWYLRATGIFREKFPL